MSEPSVSNPAHPTKIRFLKDKTGVAEIIDFLVRNRSDIKEVAFIVVPKQADLGIVCACSELKDVIKTIGLLDLMKHDLMYGGCEEDYEEH